MFKNYLILATRNLKKNKLNSMINIVGLALGLACSLLILFYLKSEISYDTFFPKADRIYRITNENLDENGLHWAVVSPLHALEIMEDIPEIEQVTRLFDTYSNTYTYERSADEMLRFKEDSGFYADKEFFSIFDIEFLNGNPESAFEKLNSMVVTESMAEKYFGDSNPLGQVIHNETARNDLTVTGVIKDLPYNSHMSFDHLVSINSLYKLMEERGASDWMESRGWAHFYTYVLVYEHADMKAVEEKLFTFTEHFYESIFEEGDVHDNLKLHLQPLTDIHLTSHLEQEMAANSNKVYVYVFAFIMILVLVLAGVNFVNLSTARAFGRMREIGVRKIVGANKTNLIRQFLSESLIIAFISAGVAIFLIEFSIPLYSKITGLSFSLSMLLTTENIIIILALVIIYGLLSGLYPAFFMSRFKVIASLKGQKDPHSSVTSIRNILVVFQFVISVFMIFSTLIIFQQMSLFQKKELGFDKDQVVALNLSGDIGREVRKNISALKNEFLAHSGIQSVAMSSNIPGERFSVEDIQQETIPDDVENPPIRYIRVDQDFIETMGIELIDGKSFVERANDNPAFILNEKILHAIRLDEPIGKIASNFRGTEAEIVGIVKDFNFASLHNTIEPLVIEFNPNWASYLLVKMRGRDIAQILEYLKQKFQEISPGSLFNYTFLDDKLNTLYANEHRLNRIFKTFTILALIISCLGLFGLSAYYAELKTKEIGVRKVLGANLPNIIKLLSYRFLIWVCIANIIALPFAWFAMNSWLQNFAYKISISPLIFIVSLCTSIVIAFITISYRIILAAHANPVKALKHE